MAKRKPHRDDGPGRDPFFDGLLELWRRRDLVLASPRFAAATDPRVLYGVVYVGARTLSLGELFSAWARGELQERCPACGGDVLVTNAGTGLTFTVWTGVCRACGQWSRRRTGPQRRFAEAAFAHEPHRVQAPRVTVRGRRLDVSGPEGAPAPDLSIADVMALLGPDEGGPRAEPTPRDRRP